MRAIALQMDIAWENPHANFAKVEKLLANTVIENYRIEVTG